MSHPIRSMQQASAYDSPWSVGSRIKLVLWMLVWLLLFRPTPKPFRAWRVLLLRIFGARITGTVFVAASTRIKFPWKLTMEDRACLAHDSHVYNLGHVTIKARATIAQEVYLCTGTHDLTNPSLPLMTGEITVGGDAFVGVRALILPGVEIAPGAVIGAGSIVTKDMPPWTICAGNPCRPLKPRNSNPMNNSAGAQSASN